MKRYQSRLSFRVVNDLKSQKIMNAIDEHDIHFAKWLEKWLFKDQLKKKLIVNVDDTRLTISGEQHKLKLIESKYKTKSSMKSSKKEENHQLIFHLFILMVS